MYEKYLAKLKRFDRKQTIAAAGIVLVIILLVLVVVHLTRPQRSIANYCKVYKQESSQLAKVGNNGGMYSTSVFPNISSNDPGPFIPVFNKLDAVAPSDIDFQVKAMRDIWVEMKDSPTQTLSAALNGLPEEQAVTQWTQQHCGT